MTTAIATPRALAEQPARPDSEATFYRDYDWVLNPFLTIPEAADRIRAELSRLPGRLPDWQEAEIRLNVVLLACLVSDTVDDYLLGAQYDFSQVSNVFAATRLITRPVNRLFDFGGRVRGWTVRRLSAWRDKWEDAICAFANVDPTRHGESETAGRRIISLLDHNFPSKLRTIRARIPAAFRSQDLTHFDVHRLGRKFLAAYPDASRPVLVIGLRTAGSYFAPLLRAFLKSQGRSDVAAITLRPKAGVGYRERARMGASAAAGAMAVIIDEPVYSASTVSRGIDCLRNAGFSADRIAALFPVHPHKRNWCSGAAALALADIRVLALEPEQWHKVSLLEPEVVRVRLAEYMDNPAIRVRCAESREQDLAAKQEPGFHCRLKRVFEVEVPGQMPPKRTILAKSTGWGWLGYHAFLAGTRLRPRVPQLLGVRDGIAYMEWLEPHADIDAAQRANAIAAASDYIAARVNTLGLTADPAPEMSKDRRHRGTEELAETLSGAYNSKIASVLRRPGLQDELGRLVCEKPTLIDGKMRPEEWISWQGDVLKTDFEHHGMGKHQLNVTDPAFDLADTILYWRLTAKEEQALISAYVRRSGDDNVGRRVFLNKLLAGTWAMARATDGLKDPAQLQRHGLFHERYLTAWNFLVIHTTRFCGALVEKQPTPAWGSPVAVLDVDGVIDKQMFGFPSSTAAGMQAISTLASHGFTIALNTARSVTELKEYCRAYGFVGGVAEYGAYAWDSVNDHDQVLVSGESLEQIARLRDELKRLPGVFVNDAYRYSIRAYTFARGATIPIPEMQVRTVIERLRLDRLRLHQTFTDSTVTAAETDKGNGLKGLLSLCGCPDVETVAVGDTEPDLAMFRVATRCFAPGHMSCPDLARRLGCWIAEKGWQPGLLEIARHVVHPNGGSCSKCVPVKSPGDPWNDLFFNMLRIADGNPARLLVSSMLRPKALGAFVK